MASDFKVLKKTRVTGRWTIFKMYPNISKRWSVTFLWILEKMFLKLFDLRWNGLAVLKCHWVLLWAFILGHVVTYVCMYRAVS